MTNWTVEQIFEDVLSEMVSEKHQKLFEVAQKQFVTEADESDFIGLDEWYVFHFRCPSSGKTTLETFLINEPQSDAKKLIKSFRSIFEVRIENEKTVLKDLFTKADFVLENALPHQESLVSLRLLLNENGEYASFGETYTFEPLYKETIFRHFMNHYNQYVSAYGHTRFETFLDLQGHLIYKMLTVINQLYDDQYTEEELELFEGVYLYNMSDDALIERLMTLAFVIEPDDEDENIYRLFSGEEMLAELELLKPKLHVLCNRSAHLQQVMKAFESVLDDQLVFASQQTVSLDAFLEE